MGTDKNIKLHIVTDIKGLIKMVQLTTQCVPTQVYPYVYHFLIDNGLKKSAKCLKKESGTDLFARPTGPDIIEIFSHVFNKKETDVSYNAVPLVYNVDTNLPDVQNNEAMMNKEKKTKKKRKLDVNGGGGQDVNGISEAKKKRGDEEVAVIGDQVLEKKKRKK